MRSSVDAFVFRLLSWRCGYRLSAYVWCSVSPLGRYAITKLISCTQKIAASKPRKRPGLESGAAKWLCCLATSDAITCIDYAVSKGARILNNSWGGGPFEQSLFDAIDSARQKGVLFVAAAGNDSNDNDSSPGYPASYQLANVIAVAAIDRNDQLASFSNYGQNSVHLGAPGVAIYSSVASADDAYDIFDGTSMATPHVSGVAALILAHYPDADLDELRGRILLSTVPVPALNGRTTTGGRLNAYKALTITGSGELVVTVDPPSGESLLSGSAQPVFVKVRDVFAVNNATVTGSIGGITNLVFNNAGQAPDAVANDDIYSAYVLVPGNTNPLTLTLTITAPGKASVTNVINYSVVPAPDNDDFEHADKVPAGGALYVSNNRFATMEPGEPQHDGIPGVAGSLWWFWNSLSPTNMLVDCSGSAINAVVAAYTGSSLTTLRQVAAVADTQGNKRANLTFTTKPDTGYWIAVSSVDTNSLGTVRVRIVPGGQLDTTPPVVSFTGITSGSFVSDSQIIVGGIASDPPRDASGVKEVLVGVNGNIASPANGTTNWTKLVTLSPGRNYIQAVAVDASENTSDPVTMQLNYHPQIEPNDYFVNAATLPGTAGSVSATNSAATLEPGEPMIAGKPGGKSLWWSWTAPADGVLVLTTTNSSFDTLLGVFIGDAVNGLTPVASNDDAFQGVSYSKVATGVLANQTYRIVVDGLDGVSGTLNLQYEFTPEQVFRLTTSASIGGRVSPPSGDYASNSTVTVTANADAGHVFDHWEGDITSFSNPLLVVVKTNLSVEAVFDPTIATDDFETGGLAKLPWTTTTSGGAGPAAAWFVETNVVAAGKFAAQSGPIGDSQGTSLILEGKFGDGLGGFDYRVSSEANWDFLQFYLDGTLLQSWSGDTGWSHYDFTVTAGSHSMEWRYLKDPANSAGLDAAFIDNVNVPYVPAPNAGAAATLSIEQGSNGTVTLQIRGQAEQTYVLQETTNLLDHSTQWNPVLTNVTSSGLMLYSDPNGSQAPAKYYRAIVPKQ